jgi:hypothetical protein
MNTEQEEWRPVINRYGNPSNYAVSSLGRVMSKQPSFEGKILKNGEGPDSPSKLIRRVWVTDVIKGPNAPMRVDLIVALAFLGKPSDGVYRVVHKNGCIWDDRAENLAWAVDVPPSHLTPAPLQGTLSEEQAQDKVNVAKKGLQRAVELLEDALRELALAQARKEAQTTAQGPEE